MSKEYECEVCQRRLDPETDTIHLHSEYGYKCIWCDDCFQNTLDRVDHEESLRDWGKL